MAITRQRFDRIKADWGDHSSWAVWTPRAETEPAKARIGDLSVLDPDVNPSLLDALRPDVILLGLNGSSRGAEMEREPLRNFHDPSRNGQDYKIRDVLADTPWWGAFMTDVITGHYETRSGEVGRYIRTHPDEVRAQAKALEAKVAGLGVGQTKRHRNTVVPSHLSVLAALRLFGAVPELAGVRGPNRRTLGGDGQGAHDLLPEGPLAVVVPNAGSAVVEPQAQAVGHASHSRMALAAVVNFKVGASVTGHPILRDPVPRAGREMVNP